MLKQMIERAADELLLHLHSEKNEDQHRYLRKQWQVEIDSVTGRDRSTWSRNGDEQELPGLVALKGLSCFAVAKLLPPGEHRFSRFLKLLGSVEVWTDHVSVVRSVCNHAMMVQAKCRDLVEVAISCFLKEQRGEGCISNGDFDLSYVRAEIEYVQAQEDFGRMYEFLHYILAEIRLVRTHFPHLCACN